MKWSTPICHNYTVQLIIQHLYHLSTLTPSHASNDNNVRILIIRKFCLTSAWIMQVGLYCNNMPQQHNTIAIATRYATHISEPLAATCTYVIYIDIKHCRSIHDLIQLKPYTLPYYKQSYPIRHLTLMLCYLMPSPPTHSHIPTQPCSITYHLHSSLSADSNGGDTRCGFTARGVIPISDHATIQPCMSRVCSWDYESHVTLRIPYLDIWKYLEVDNGGKEKEEGKGEGEESRREENKERRERETMEGGKGRVMGKSMV